MKKRKLKGYIYTLSAILLSISLVMLIVFYYGLTETGTGTTKLGETKTEETEMTAITSKIRCDELHYFVEDIKESMSRGLLIGGRRAALYLIDQVTQNGTPVLSNYTMDTTNCPFAENLNTSIRGSEAAIAELLICGRYNGKESEEMKNHTLSAWRNKMIEKGNRAGLTLDMSFGNISISPYDAWHFVITTEMSFNVSDRANICHFSGYNTKITSISSIIALEDPLYPIKTSSRIYKYITPCDEPEYLPEIKIGIGTLGKGSAGGTALFLSSINSSICPGTDANKIICCAQDMTKCVEGVNDPKKVILIIDNNSNVINDNNVCDDSELKGNLSLYKGVIDFNCNNYSYNISCLDNLSISYVIGTGDLTIPTSCNKTGCEATHCSQVNNTNCSCDVNNHVICNGTGVKVDCTNSIYGFDNFLSNYMCVFLMNNGSEHSVGRGLSCRDINTSCYYISNITKYNAPECPNYLDGPSFFDRLEGKLNLSTQYADEQSSFCNTSCNNPDIEWPGKEKYCSECNKISIGIESFVDLQEFYDRGLFGVILQPYKNETWVDYLYFLNQNSTSELEHCSVDICNCSVFNFNIDCQHAYRYGIKSATKSCI